MLLSLDYVEPIMLVFAALLTIAGFLRILSLRPEPYIVYDRASSTDFSIYLRNRSHGGFMLLKKYLRFHHGEEEYEDLGELLDAHAREKLPLQSLARLLKPNEVLPELYLKGLSYYFASDHFVEGEKMIWRIKMADIIEPGRDNDNLLVQLWYLRMYWLIVQMNHVDITWRARRLALCYCPVGDKTQHLQLATSGDEWLYVLRCAYTFAPRFRSLLAEYIPSSAAHVLIDALAKRLKDPKSTFDGKQYTIDADEQVYKGKDSLLDTVRDTLGEVFDETLLNDVEALSRAATELCNTRVKELLANQWADDFQRLAAYAAIFKVSFNVITPSVTEDRLVPAVSPVGAKRYVIGYDYFPGHFINLTSS